MRVGRHEPLRSHDLLRPGRPDRRFVVNRDGSLTDLKIERPAHPLLEKEGLRVVQKMPRWVPGHVNGVPVRARHATPFRFRLE